MGMAAPESKKLSLSEQGKLYIAQLEEEGKPFYKLDHQFKQMFADRIKELLEKKKDNDPK
jgi:hypothetical protein